ncbi:RNA 2',3'-cyclic phosphodiesterase [Aquabacterium sp. A7-Y]|uniref:RNA 2',3'-cyclic phosphodiesterase n=1 Tax=Aquabacterium sp. A7-Y TaxID=1349605 RepID=UPI00223D25CA|nr:RNA 2',3'-cyclic phosphodiesterase [Aquabacterium sp. A7-Y]MCW7536596.1 RNA 2',3'-cyclic phosphodiesterase [Aquabacterium sp. A7-Y]
MSTDLPLALPAGSDPSRCTRLFFALWPGPVEREALVARQRLWQWPAGARLSRPARLHLTLHFLAQVPVERVAEFADAGAVAGAPFELGLQEAGLWNGVAWLRPAAAPEALRRLHADLGAALQGLGWTPESRGFEPHVTLARDARGAVPPAGLPELRWRVGEHVLVESVLGPQPEYRVLRRYPWGPAGV